MELVTLKSPTESILKIKGSKFVGSIFPIETEDQFRDKVDHIKKMNPDATHYCLAFRFHNFHQVIEFQSDDGEPSGSAGLPMLNKLRSLKLIQVGAVVIRYYGGTKLGKPGLIEAYSESVQQAYLSNPALVNFSVNRLFEIEHNYEMTNTLKSVFERTLSTIITSEYTDSVKIVIGVPADQMDKFAIELNQLDSRYIKVSDTGNYKMISRE